MTYQGHKSRSAWSVALNLFNDYGIYRMMSDAVKRTATLDDAASQLTELLKDKRTADGYRYTKTSVRLALQHWEH